MPSTAGFQLVAGRIPGERIGTSLRTSANATFTNTEVQQDSITVPLVAGRTYGIWYWGLYQKSVADGYIRVRIREDNTTGTQLQLDQVHTAGMTVDQPEACVMYAEYTAVSTGNKTFVVGALRQAGTGNATATATANQPTRFWVEYVSG